MARKPTSDSSTMVGPAALDRGDMQHLRTRNGQSYIASLRKRFGPEDLPAMIWEAYAMADRLGDPRTMLECVKLVMAYTVGKPANGEGSRDTGANALQAALADWIQAKADAARAVTSSPDATATPHHDEPTQQHDA